MLAPLIADEADAVFGSRMLTRLGALKGGMPLYKFVGNRILSWIQNALLGTTLSEFHSGFRAYRVSSLRRLPFQVQQQWRFISIPTSSFSWLPVNTELSRFLFPPIMGPKSAA